MNEFGEGTSKSSDQDQTSTPSLKKCETSKRKLDFGIDDKICRICLSEQTNSCQAQPCLHRFCFNCLLEWSKVKRRCPLCKVQLQSIKHNVRADGDCDIYYPSCRTGGKNEDGAGCSYMEDEDDDFEAEFMNGNVPSCFKQEQEPRPSCSYALDSDSYDNIWSS